jgi:hypothetical protein
MEAISSFLTEDRVAPLVTTTVARTYLASVPLQPKANPRAEPKIEGLRSQVSLACFQAAAAVERLLNQLGDPADRVVLSRAGGIAFIFLGGAKYAMLESDEEGSLVALLSDRASTLEAESWVVEANGLTAAVRKIRSFVGSPHGANP